MPDNTEYRPIPDAGIVLSLMSIEVYAAHRRFA